FLSVYNITKQNYFQDLLKCSLHQSYTSFEAKQGILFDEKGSCAKLQKVAYATLKKTLNLSDNTDDISLLFLYNELIERINRKVGLPLDSLEDLLAVTYKDQDISELLRLMGYTKNPLVFTKKKHSEKKRILHSSNPQQREDDISLTIGSYPSSFVQTPFDQTSFGQIIPSDNGLPFTLPQYRQRKKVRTIKASFAACMPYTISLFKAQHLIPEELVEIQIPWKACQGTSESWRVKVLFALADSLALQKPILKLTTFGCPLIECNDESYDESIREKLDLNHLFTRLVDSSLRSYGIAEKVDNLIQVSIPGEMGDCQGRKKVGFFQYSFIPDTWICIHRCFKSYDANQYGIYISPALRKILYDFLITISMADDSYRDVIDHLKLLINEGK
ncbi:hypothetical protein H0W26_05645, partial [Candidatus Dependentiae bacterium]|nr:hypothetical protein [Candidatus Dependentiae bacterium]